MLFQVSGVLSICVGGSAVSVHVSLRETADYPPVVMVELSGALVSLGSSGECMCEICFH